MNLHIGAGEAGGPEHYAFVVVVLGIVYVIVRFTKPADEDDEETLYTEAIIRYSSFKRRRRRRTTCQPSG